MTVSTRPQTDLKAQVLAVINEHQGWENAIKSQVIAEMFGYRNDRVIQMAVERLINEDKEVIAASCKADKKTGQLMGYYIPVTDDQENDYIHQLRGRALGDFKRYRSFRIARDLRRKRVVQGKLFDVKKAQRRAGTAGNGQRTLDFRECYLN